MASHYHMQKFIYYALFTLSRCMQLQIYITWRVLCILCIMHMQPSGTNQYLFYCFYVNMSFCLHAYISIILFIVAYKH